MANQYVIFLECHKLMSDSFGESSSPTYPPLALAKLNEMATISLQYSSALEGELQKEKFKKKVSQN